MSLPHRSVLALAIAALFSAPVLAADYAALPQAEVAQAVAQGGVVLHDYGSFAWVRGSGRGADAQATYALDLGGRVFDPASDTAARAEVYGTAPALRLVQFDGPVKQQWLDSLRSAGAQPLQFIAPFAYVVWADGTALRQARGISAVRWSGDFLPAYKQATAADGRQRDERSWQAMVYRGARLGDAAFSAVGASVVRRAPVDAQFEIVELETAAPQLDALALLPGVYTLQPVPRNGGKRTELANQITANNLNASNLPVPGYLAWLTTVGVNGAGVKIANVDGGIYDTAPDLVNRMLPCIGDTCGGSAVDDHGTHTAGIMAGDGSSGVNDPNGFRRGLGMAPGANLIEQVYSPTFTQAGGMLKLMRQSHDNGADLSGNSWGPSGSPRGYDADTRQVDVGTRDTKPDVAGDQPLTYVLSFMNGGGGTSSQGTPDEAKNVITVGSTKGQNGNLSVIPRFNDISSNSAHGPALDGRRIPHLVAPGCEIDSIVSATGYGTMCGTSMASPQVSGAVALFIQKYRSTHAGASPSTALIKAALVASALDLNGNFDADGGPLAHRPDNKQGWGRLRADWLVNATAPVLYYDQNTRVFDNTGEDWSLSVAPADTSRPLQLVLVYTDAPGHGLGGSTPAWNNDLDLQVTGGANTWRGNVFGANGYSATGGTADNRNNIESVWLDAATAAAAGALTVRVIASNITSDALPNAGDATDQDFALVCSNCVSQPDYTVAAAVPAQSVCTTAATTASYAVGIGSLMGYTSTVSLSLAGLPAGAGGTVTPNAVTPPGSATVGLTALNAVAPGTHTFQLNSASASGNRSRDLGITVANATPAAPALSAPADNASNVAVRPALSWAASAQAADYVVEIATDAAFANIVSSQAVSATTATPAADLATSTAYFWRVRPANICGNGSSSAVYRFTTVAAPGDCGPGTSANVILSNGVEGGQGAWTTSSGAGSANWTISNARPYGGSGYAWLAQNPAVTSDQRLTSPPITLPSGQNPLTLQFQSDQTLESDSGGCWDGGFLEISTNGGSTFSAIPAAAMLTDPYDGALSSDNPAPGIQAWCGDPQAYLRSVVDLNAYAGQTVQLRFRLTSDNLIGRLPHGWYVDDIKVQGCRAPLGDAIFANGFDPQA